jgi:hypothetical protein
MEIIKFSPIVKDIDFCKLSRNGVTVYEGAIRDGLYHGEGMHTDDNGNTYWGEFLQGARSGKGTLTNTLGTLFVGEFFDNVYHGPGRMRLHQGEGMVFADGIFENGLLPEGCIIDASNTNNTLIYDGALKDFKPHGVGKAFRNNWVIQGRWKEGILEHGFTAQFEHGKTHTTGVMSCAAFSISEYSKNTHYEQYVSDATEMCGDVITFKGTCRVSHNLSEGVSRRNGTIYVGGKPRISGHRLDKSSPRVDSIYDENGILALKIRIGMVPESKWVNGEYPQLIMGLCEIYDECGKPLYSDAHFYEGRGMGNALECADRTPLMCVFRENAAVDFISFDEIPFETVAYALNSSNHIISLETLQQMIFHNRLVTHPLTRVPIMRVFRVMVFKI